ncbi:MAG: Rne/Rng family ribonuclease [Actinomycetes bacterium]|nr:Rne/Rng family ribonuclease [Actinomycetes bacterium]MDX5379995.1 Rne/Rng family ribonuclease [Actinomycetes bacterium]MDX5398526.1 Rne/Rng family ribonuclease [Actinomycetes bacterium]MDX5449694.1 Rne/Rng family ribonuclease [Actinomycetes bacterium]
MLFQAPDLSSVAPRRAERPRDESSVGEKAASEERPSAREDSGEEEGRRRRRGGRGRKKSAEAPSQEGAEDTTDAGKQDAGKQDADKQDGGKRDATQEPGGARAESATDTGEAQEEGGSRRRRRRRRPTDSERAHSEVTSVEGSTRLEAKRQRRREGRDAGRRRQVITESEFLARREAVDRTMLVREKDGLNQIAVLEDGILVEHYVARRTQTSMVGNVYLGRVQNVLPSMEAAFIDLGKGRNAVLYAGEVNWDAAGMEGQPRRIEQALHSGDTVLVQVTKDPIGHKGARLTSQVTLAGRHLVLVPSGAMTGISRKLPESERARLKRLLKEIVPDSAGVIVRTAAEGATEEQLRDDVARLLRTWEDIQSKATSAKSAPLLLKGEPELAVRVVRDVFNEDFTELVVSGDEAWRTISRYVEELSPDLAGRLRHWVEPRDIFSEFRIDEQLAKGMDRKVWLPSGGSLVIDRTEAMTVIDVNTGRFTGAGGTLEETVTRNNLEAAEEIVRQLRLRDIGGIIVIDFIDMVLESNRDLVLRRLMECLGRDRTRHQVAEVTSLGLVQMTRKRVGQGLVEAFSEPCEHCGGRGFIVHTHPVEKDMGESEADQPRSRRRGRGRADEAPAVEPNRKVVKDALATIAAAAASAHEVHEAVAPEVADAITKAATGVADAVAADAPDRTSDDTAATQQVDVDVPTDAGPDDGDGTPTRPRRGGRRRVVATVAPAADATADIITLPTREESPSGVIVLPKGEETSQAPSLPPETLDTLVFPERSEASRPPRRRPRRATSATTAPPEVETPDSASADPGPGDEGPGDEGPRDEGSSEG